MKPIPMTELQVNDIFCHQLKLTGREAFIVDEVNEKNIVCRSRITGSLIKRQKKVM